jgi:hypothetical protein
MLSRIRSCRSLRSATSLSSLHLAQRFKSAQSDSAVLDQEIEYFASKKQVGVTLRTLMETG